MQARGAGRRWILLLGLSLAWAAAGRDNGAAAIVRAQPQADAARRGPKMRLWVPAYYYPNGPGLQEWERLMVGAKRVPTVAIVNPNSGPGDHLDTNYAAVVPRALRSGLTVVGYVATQYGRKPIEQVEAEVDTYLRFYPGLQGIHVDEQASDVGHVAYYGALYDAIRRRIRGGLVLGNPGTECVPEYVSRPAADAVCLFEQDRGLDRFRPPAWLSRFPASRFCVQSYHVEREAEMRQDVQKAARNGIGYVFITDRTAPNPYDRLPSYWEAEIAVVQQLNAGRD